MIEWVALLNNVSVSIFGSVLSASFCNALNSRQKRWLFGIFIVCNLLLQGWLYSMWDVESLRRVYPLVVHLPLILVLCIFSKTLIWPIICVFSTYLCCQVRRWIALMTVALFSGGEFMQNVVELIVTLPLLLLLLRIVAPSVRQLASCKIRQQIEFGVIPAIYYGFDYLTTVYTELLSSGNPVVVEFMPFVCSIAYLVFWLYHSSLQQKRFQLQQAQETLRIQLNQSVREIDALRESQSLTRQYRHDLRHHLQYLSACIHNEQYEQAQSYICDICNEIDAQKVQNYCENEAANLILSVFVGRARKNGIDMKIHGFLPSSIMIAEKDLCVLLSNALENALNACLLFAQAGKECTIDVQFYERLGKIFLQVTNPCDKGICFEDGIPVSNQPDHGIGVQSICAIVRRYDGLCTFTQRDGIFIFRLSI